MIEHSSKFKRASKDDLFQCIKSVRKCKNSLVATKFPSLDMSKPLSMVIFTDASYANLPDKVSSSLGFVIFLVDQNLKCCLISWKSNKIKRVCRSTLSAETMALVEGLEECLYLKSVLQEMGFLKMTLGCYFFNQISRWQTTEDWYCCHTTNGCRKSSWQHQVDSHWISTSWLFDEAWGLNCKTPRSDAAWLAESIFLLNNFQLSVNSSVNMFSW